MTEKAAQWVNFRRFSLVSLSFINRIPWKLVKMCILISLTKHITTTFWSHHFYMPEQANIWQKRLRWGSIFADFRLFLSHLSTEVPELGQNLYLDELNQSYYNNFLITPLLHAKTRKYMAEKAATRDNFCRFSLVSLSFINRSPWKLVKMCILISLTNHISTTFWSDQFYIPKQANIW